jgi:trehalose 6-phosphate phosphatase
VVGLSPVDPLAALRADPARAGVLVDFDGTLAPIVAGAADARPLPGAPEVLRALAAVYAVVAVVSGRPVRFLADHLPSTVRLVGLYGLEWTDGEVVQEHPEAAGWRTVIDDAAAAALVALPPAVDVEHKGLSLTLHFRPAPTAERVVRSWAADVAARTGLHQRTAKMSVELHPPLAIDKGTVVEDLAAGLAAVAYLGDDIGDLPAFAALDDLAGRGVHTVKVAVAGADAAHVVMAAADLTVAGPEEALVLLSGLL